MPSLSKRTFVGLAATGGLMVVSGLVYNGYQWITNRDKGSEDPTRVVPVGLSSSLGSKVALSACKVLSQDGELSLVAIGDYDRSGQYKCMGTLPPDEEGRQYGYWIEWDPEINDYAVIKVDTTTPLLGPNPERR